MKRTLLIPLVGPMQSWGSRSRFDDRDTHPEPTKSGVLGLVCAALGLPRDQSAAQLAELDRLRFGVRVESAGRIMRDYQTAQNVARAGGSGTSTVTSLRQYISDAAFLAGLESDGAEEALLSQIESALQNPRWPLSLGRKGYAMSVPPYFPGTSLRDGELEDVFASEPATPWASAKEPTLRVVLEDKKDTEERGYIVYSDAPQSFDSRHRRYGLRYARTDFFPIVPYQKPQEETPWSMYRKFI